jgi:hypothetical protein
MRGEWIRLNARKPEGGRVRPVLERLETRLCLSNDLAIVDFSAVALPNHTAWLSGRIVDDHPATVKIAFSGTISGMTRTRPNGVFNFLTTQAELGQVLVTATNSENHTVIAAERLDALPPKLTLDVAYLGQNVIQLYGKVADPDQAGGIVQLSGVVTQNVVTNSVGEYSYTTPATATGAVYAEFINPWGLAAPKVKVDIANLKPRITNFEAVGSPDDLWEFSGIVEDEDPEGLVVKLSGIPGLNGVIAVVGADGKFSVTVKITITGPSQARADVTDWWNYPADPAWVDIYPP